MKFILIILFCVGFIFDGASQIRDTIEINNIEYEIIIDTISHKVIHHNIIEKETFIEKIYIGFSTPVNYGNYKQEIIYDVSTWGKVSLGYDFGHKALTIGAYVSLGRLHKREDKINPIYF